MSRKLKLIAAVAAAALACAGLAACQTTTASNVAPPTGQGSGTQVETPAQAAQAAMDLPMTTTSQAARARFLAGLDRYDLQDNLSANRAFKEAVQADPNFALGYLYVGLTGSSTEEFASNLANARVHAASASQAEQLIIEGYQRAFDNNAEGQLADTTALTQLQPDSARAWLMHATVLEGLNRVPEARAAYDRALQIRPQLVAAHLQAGNDYLTLAPKDFNRAATHFRTAIDLAPNEATPYDFLGDAHRAQNQLEAARNDYTQASQRAPDQGILLQQRGHVNSFLGNYAEARADYDRAVALETARGGNNGPFLAVYRSYVNIYENKPDAAITELRALIAQADASNMEGKADLKAFALTNIAQFATHYGNYQAAEAAITDLANVTSAQAAAIENAGFRRAQEANVVYLRGMLAARRGDQAGARTQAQRFAAVVQPDANPRKLERMHEILGLAAYNARNYAQAETELAQADPNDVYVKYYRALSQLQTGHADAAQQAFSELAVYNFNDPNFALIRRDVIARRGT
jgi:cytochrome c-type biogenesis protein CcmH/NrfG